MGALVAPKHQEAGVQMDMGKTGGAWWFHRANMQMVGGTADNGWVVRGSTAWSRHGDGQRNRVARCLRELHRAGWPFR